MREWPAVLKEGGFRDADLQKVSDDHGWVHCNQVQALFLGYFPGCPLRQRLGEDVPLLQRIKDHRKWAVGRGKMPSA